MRYRRLGRTEVEVSVIGVGTWQLGGEWGKDFTAVEASSMLDQARHLGVNLIDTAECYGDHVSESLVGRAIAPPRASIGWSLPSPATAIWGTMTAPSSGPLTR